MQVKKVIYVGVWYRQASEWPVRLMPSFQQTRLTNLCFKYSDHSNIFSSCAILLVIQAPSMAQQPPHENDCTLDPITSGIEIGDLQFTSDQSTECLHSIKQYWMLYIIVWYVQIFLHPSQGFPNPLDDVLPLPRRIPLPHTTPLSFRMNQRIRLDDRYLEVTRNSPIHDLPHLDEVSEFLFQKISHGSGIWPVSSSAAVLDLDR